MAVLQVKKYKIKKDENGNKIEIPKTKEEWNKETSNGTKTWYFYDRYKINDITKQYKSGLFTLKREAYDEEIKFLANPLEYIKNNSKRAKNNIIILNETIDKKNLNEYFKDFCEYKKKYIKQASVYENIKDWNNHISNELGALVPEEITLPIAKKWHTNANNKKRIKINKKEKEMIEIPYSVKTKNKWYSCLSEFFEYLVSEGKLECNYIKLLGQFKNPNENKNTHKKIKYQTLEDFNFFMSEIPYDILWYSFFNFAFWHGCRIGEQRALRISDVNFENDMIHFHETFSKNVSGGEDLGSIKNNKERYILLAEQSKPHLIKLVEYYKQMEGYSDNWFLFGGPYNTYKNRIERQINNYYNLLISKYPNKNITSLTHHEFGRHSHASYLLNKGMGRTDIYNIIALRLGDTPEVIRRTYAHPYEDENNDKTRELLNL